MGETNAVLISKRPAQPKILLAKKLLDSVHATVTEDYRVTVKKIAEEDQNICAECCVSDQEGVRLGM